VTDLRQEDVSTAAAVVGEYTLVVHATGAGGAYSLDVSGALDPLAAAAPALTLDATPARTSDATPVLGGGAGTALGDFPGVVARVYEGGVEVRALPALVMPDGRWSVEVRPPLADGPTRCAPSRATRPGT
jgi:hypothetical protein